MSPEILSFIVLPLMGLSVLFCFFAQDLVSCIIGASLFSSLSAFEYVLLGAGDVALTEVCVGTGFTTSLMLAALKLLNTRKTRGITNIVPKMIILGITFVIFCYESKEFPSFGNDYFPAFEIGNVYLSAADQVVKIPNVISAVLADFRGYDTMCETMVIVIAATGVGAILRAPDSRPLNNYQAKSLGDGILPLPDTGDNS